MKRWTLVIVSGLWTLQLEVPEALQLHVMLHLPEVANGRLGQYWKTQAGKLSFGAHGSFGHARPSPTPNNA
jgi:hypothetical protein